MKTIFSTITIGIILLCNCMPCDATIPKVLIESHVHSLEQFLDRLNGKELFPNIPEDENDKIRATRISLINIDLLLKSENRDSIITILDQFFDTIEELGVTVGLTDTKSWIVADCIFSYNDKTIPIQLFMKMEEYKPDLWRWAITDILDVNNNLLPNLNIPLPINPLEHEINFLNLDNIFKNDYKEIYRLKSENKDIDKLSFFYGLVVAGKLTFIQCNNITFHTCSVPGWEISVSEINRIDTSNSGWLITTLQKIENQILKEQ